MLIFIRRLFNTVVQHMLSSLNDSKTNNLYEISMQIIQTYFKHNFGKHSYESMSEDEQVRYLERLAVR